MLLPAIYAHRGASAQARENTIAAFQQAIHLGADGIELDVRCTSDRVLVIYHDAAIAGRAIEQMSWAEIQALNAEIPTLDQVVRCCANRILLDVEIKEAGYEAEVLAALKPLSLNQFAITSFRLDVIDRIRPLDPEITIGFLIDRETIDLFPEVALLNHKLNAIGINFLAPDRQILNHPFVAQLLPQLFWVWTVNDQTEIQQLIRQAHNPAKARQIAAVITDYPDRALELRSSGALLDG